MPGKASGVGRGKPAAPATCGKKPMLEPNSAPGAYALLALGLMAGLLGLLGLLRRAPPSWKGPLVAAAVLAVAGAGGALAGLPVYAWWPASVFAAVLLGFSLLRSP